MSTFTIFILITLVCSICTLCLLISAAWKAGKEKQRPPDVVLEKEILRYQREDMDRDTTVRDVAHYFAQWGAEHLKK